MSRLTCETMVLHLYLEPTFLFNCEAGLDRTVLFERGGQLRIGGGVGKVAYEEGSSNDGFSLPFHCHEVKVHHVEGGVALGGNVAELAVLRHGITPMFIIYGTVGSKLYTVIVHWHTPPTHVIPACSLLPGVVGSSSPYAYVCAQTQITPML